MSDGLTRKEVRAWGRNAGIATGIVAYFPAALCAWAVNFLTHSNMSNPPHSKVAIGVIIGIAATMAVAIPATHPSGRPWSMQAKGGTVAVAEGVASAAAGAAGGFGAFVALIIVMVCMGTVGLMWVLASAALIVIVVT